MRFRCQLLGNLLRDDKGFTALEYTLITVIIGAVVLTGVDVIGGALTSAYAQVSGVLAAHAALAGG